MSAFSNQSKKYDVFISYYSKTGIDFARFLKKGLLDFNVTTFLDEEDIPKSVNQNTDEWRQHIDTAIKESSNFVLIMTVGFNKRPEVIRELKLAFEIGLKKYFAKQANLGKTDVIISIDDKTVDLTNYENIFFSNEADLLRKVISALLGKLTQSIESQFESEAKRMISSEGLDLKKTNNPLVELVIGSTNDNVEWLFANAQNQFLVSRFPAYVEIEVRRSFFESKPSNEAFLKVQTNGLFHIILPLYLNNEDNGKGRDFYFDNVFYQTMKPFLFCVRLMKFHKIKSEQSLVILLKNVGGKSICFDTWAGRLSNYTFTKSLPEIQFQFSFHPDEDWKKIVEKVLFKFYRELCTEAGCIEIIDLTIKHRMAEIIRNMRELSTRYLGDNIELPIVDISSFGLE